MRGLGWFLLANFELLYLGSLTGLIDASWSLAVAAFVFLIAGASLLLGSDRVAAQIAGMVLEMKNIDLRVKMLGRRTEGPNVSKPHITFRPGAKPKPMSERETQDWAEGKDSGTSRPRKEVVISKEELLERIHELQDKE